VRVHVSNPALVEDLVSTFRRWSCNAERVDEQTIFVSIPRSFSEEGARRELDLYLRVWEATHPGAFASRL
jgi:hypothetical protein